MSDLDNFNNIYANLAESAYKGRPNNFPPNVSKSKETPYDFSKDYINKKTGKIQTYGGTNLPNNGVVYLQPDKTLETTTYYTSQIVDSTTSVSGFDQIQVPHTSQKGLLTDEKAGFNAYFVTDTPKLNKETKETYLAVRGSDSISMENLNDWVANDGNFALTHAYIPQAKLAYKALISKIEDIKKQAPNAKLNVTGHSLGTMVSAQAVAKLYHDYPKDFSTIGKVVLFDGPDVTKSLKKMGLSDKEIKAVGEKVTYYVNPFDVVSMLNRTAPYEEQFGHVNVIVPVHFSKTLDKISSHDFGEFQMDAYGNPLVASKNFHPEMLTAGHQLADLIEKSVSKVEAAGISGVSASEILAALSEGVLDLIALGLTAAAAKAIYDEFKKSYQDIVSEANKKAKAWNAKHIPDYQNRIRSASGSQKVELRVELLQCVAQDAMIRAEEFTKEVKTDLSDALEKIQKEIKEGIQAISDVVHYLETSEVFSLLTELELPSVWDKDIEEHTNQEARTFQTEIEEFSATLIKIVQNIEQVDSQGATGFNTLMNQTRVNWGATR
ncbi:lipase family protein [Lactococcus ileimucosae]|uniref:lipase family protein n=1 Tax=Lactococcus ileimucosae TaxID=2941329 RepID=UPI0020448CE5|nr:hypothetical protein [Lactococcus ileimucosae]